MSFSQKQNDALGAALDPKHIKKPSGNFGPKGDYLEGWHVINEANRIFGFDGWSYTTSLEKISLVEGQDSKGNPQWQAAYTCICSVTVDDVFRQDVGFGSGFAKQIGDAVEGATKEAATDALKRALRTFGNQFGLALYDKERASVAEPAPPTITAEQAQILSDLFKETGRNIGPYLAKAGKTAGRTIEAIEQLPPAEFEPLRTHLENVSQKEPA